MLNFFYITSSELHTLKLFKVLENSSKIKYQGFTVRQIIFTQGLLRKSLCSCLANILQLLGQSKYFVLNEFEKNIKSNP